MKRFIITLILISSLVTTASAQTITAPTIPQEGRKYMPSETESFGDGLWYIIKAAIGELEPKLKEAAGDCLGIFALVLLLSVIKLIPVNTQKVVAIGGSVGAGVLLLRPTGSLIHLGLETIQSVADYGKMLISVLTTALATQGGIQSSTALYAVTTVFCTLLTSLISKILIPMVYIFLCISFAGSALDHSAMVNLKSTIKKVMLFSLKTILYVFTGFITITGVVSGTTDASALKATKLTISGVVPVVGGILSEASEAVLVSASLMKNAAGIYGLLAVISIGIGPFLRIGVQYLLVKLTSALCDIFAVKEVSKLIQDFSDAMGLVLAIVGTSTVMLLISIICYMKGMA